MSVSSSTAVIASGNKALRVAMAVERFGNNQAATNAVDSVNKASSNKTSDSQEARRSSHSSGPGIRVTLDAQSVEPGIEDYRRLKSQGRRKIDVPQQENLAQTQQTHETDSASASERVSFDDKASSNKRGPQSRVVLDNFIQQMMGIETPPVPGANINISV